MNRTVKIFGALVGAVVLTGCSYKGTTYGTGVTHEEQTAKSLMNMFDIVPEEGKKIDYTARPDLVMPSRMDNLPDPNAVQSASVGDENWPVSPDQRIEAVRAAAVEEDEYGNLPTQYLTSEKEGIRNSADTKRAALNRETRLGGREGGGEQFIEAFKDDANGVGDGVEARRLREQISYSNGVQRKYLTEPPSEYRKPAETAEAGELGITKEQLSELEKKDERNKRDADWGIITPGSN